MVQADEHQVDAPLADPPQDQNTDDQADAQGELEEARQQIQQLQKDANDAKAREGTWRSQQERDRLLDGVVHELKYVSQTNEAIAKAIGSGDIDSVGPEIERIHQESASTEAQSQVDREQQSFLRDFEGAAKEVGYDYINSPELEEARNTWRVATSIAGVSAAYRQAMVVINRKAADNARNEVAGAVERAAGEAKKAALDEAEVNDLSSGTGSGGSVRRSQTPLEIYNAYGRGERPWSPDVREAQKALGLSI